MPQDTTAVCPHGKPYAGIEQCGECRATAGAAVDMSSPKANTLAPRTRAAEYRLCQASCWEEYRANIKEDPQVAVKFSAEAGKWAGRADELELRILEIEHDQWLVDQKRRLGGGD